MSELYGGASSPLLKFLSVPPTSTLMNPQQPVGVLLETDPIVNKPLMPAVPAPSGTAAVQLDADALARLRELDPDGSHGIVERVLRAFEASLERMLGQLAAQRDNGDAAVVSGVAHTLKSSSASVGALALAQACAEVERRLRTGGPGSLGGDVERLLDHGEAALAAVEAMLRQ